MKKLSLLIIFNAYLSACTQSVETVIIPATPACSSTTAEISECLSNMATTSPVTITGSAQFYKRTIKVGTNYLNLGAPISTALPIKYAEVRVLNSTGTVVQCGSTDANGNYTNIGGTGPLQISGTAGNYTVQVMARSKHAIDVGGGKPVFQLYTSVKKDICSNEVHKTSASITVPGSLDASTTAMARESDDANISGGAFNILNDLYTTYEYLSNKTTTQDLTCLNPKLNVYWMAGFNPAQYIYTDQNPSDVDPLSFYLRGYNELYISGGKLGNVATADTDHFDDAVIIHELGHHIEDVCGKMDSPGGNHNGLFRIDPRLAWSEGWGNFMGAHIIKNNLAEINPEIVSSPNLTAGWNYYLDTYGYRESAGESSANELIKLDLTKAGSDGSGNPGTGYYYDKVDSTNNPGEGHFREVAIARSLFKINNTCANLCTNNDNMPKVWTALVSMKPSSNSFRSSTLFYSRLRSLSPTPSTSFDYTINNDEAMQAENDAVYASSWPAYGIKLVASGTACPIKIQPKRQSSVVTNLNPATTQITGNDEASDQRYSNHFYRLDLAALTGVTEINMSISKSAGTTLDFDMILFQEGYRYVNETCQSRNSSGVCTAYSKTTSSSEFVRSDRSIASTPSTSFTKKIQTLNLLSSSTAYLLNIRAYTAGITTSSNTEYTYQLTDQSGGYLCPAATY